MTYRTLSPAPCVALVLLSLAGSLAAQGRPGGNTGNTPGSTTGQPAPNPNLNFPNSFPSTANNGPTFISGKVRIGDGTALTDEAVIQSVCDGRVRNEGRTDFKGNFSFEVDSYAGGMMADQVDGNVSATGFGVSQDPRRKRDMSRCELQAVLPGFTSQTITLAGRVQGAGTADVGTIVLNRMGQVEGLTISATSAAAPDKAKKEFEKGRDEAKKQKWDSAAEHFSKAVEIYPKYAIAWTALGQVQVEKRDMDRAKASFQHAIDADSKYVTPYTELVSIAGQDKQWKVVVDLSDKVLAMNPLSYPQHWYFNAVGNYFLQNMDQAEKSARKGIEVDVQHQVPRLEYMLAMALVQKHDYQGAVVHIRTYVKLAPKASDADTAQKQLAELEKATASAAPVSK